MPPTLSARLKASVLGILTHAGGHASINRAASILDNVDFKISRTIGAPTSYCLSVGGKPTISPPAKIISELVHDSNSQWLTFSWLLFVLTKFLFIQILEPLPMAEKAYHGASSVTLHSDSRNKA
jgi:hypothetical protein